ncbi:Hint domain-containing protein [Gimesia maris]|uniref:Hint domain-containing protein n=1 Tax=Gimesia maris TaxID=122 RepID=UPI0021BBF849|nr:Hint domain-containing protein [Gimesia maris]
MFCVAVEGKSKPIGTTPNHPIWSVDREAFIRADSLSVGEQLQTLNGIARVTSITPRGPPEPVYNLEVQVKHTYFVADSGVLVHNGGLCPKAQLKANRAAGKAGEKFLEDTYGGVSQVYRKTSSGGRYIDNLADGVARESKVGRTSASKFVRTQVAKDVELLSTPNNGIDKIEWHFFRSKTGKIGPTGPLEKLLELSGITINY